MAKIDEPRVRETTATEGALDLELSGAMLGSLAFGEIMVTGDTCDYAVSYGNTFETGSGTLLANGKLERTVIHRARHANGVVDTNKVSLPPGIKTVIMTVAAHRAQRLLDGGLDTAGLATNAVTNAKIRQSTALSIVGRSANSVGDVADISAATNGHILRRSADVVGFGVLDPASVTLAMLANLGHGKFIGRLTAADGVPEACGIVFGQCILSKVSTNILLLPDDGNLLTINSRAESVPDAGVSLSPTGLTVGTLYYIYAYMVSTTMTLEASTTAPATQAGTGVRIKTGDATRTLVGQGRPITGPEWADTATQRFVRSYFNDPGVVFSNSFTTNRTAVSGTFTEINSEIRVEGLFWSDDLVSTNFNGSVDNSASTNIISGIGFDGTTPEVPRVTSFGTTNITPMAVNVSKRVTDGYHYATVVGLVAAPAVGTWYSAGSCLSGFARR